MESWVDVFFLFRVQVLRSKMSYALFPLPLGNRSPEMLKPWLKAHIDTTSCRSPPSSGISFPFWASLSQGTRIDGFWFKVGDSWSTEVLFSVSFHLVIFAWETAEEHSSWGWLGALMQVLRKSTLSALKVWAGFSFSSTKRGSVRSLEEMCFLGDGGSCFPRRTLSSWPRFHSACTEEARLPQSRLRLLSLGALDLFWNKEYTLLYITQGLSSLAYEKPDNTCRLGYLSSLY